MEGAAKAPVEVERCSAALPGFAHQLVGLAPAAEEEIHDFAVGATAEDRGDERLDDRGGSLLGADVAPGLQGVRAVQVPCRPSAGVVDVGREVNRALHLAEGVGKMAVGRGVVGGVSAEDHQRIHLSGAHGAGELDHLRGAGGRAVEGGHVTHRLADVAESVIECLDERMDGGGLPASGHDQAFAAAAREIGGHRLDQAIGACIRGRRGAHRSGDVAEIDAELRELVGEREGDLRDEAAGDAQTMVGGGAGDRERALDRVESAHPGGAERLDVAPGGEAPRLLERAPVGDEKVGVERDEDPRFRDIERCLQWATEGEARAFQRFVAAERLVANDARPGQRRAKLAEEPRQRG